MFPCDCVHDVMKRSSYHGGSAFSFSSGIYYQIGSDQGGIGVFELFFLHRYVYVYKNKLLFTISYFTAKSMFLILHLITKYGLLLKNNCVCSYTRCFLMN